VPDDDRPHSGSRWEPAAPPSSAETAELPAAETATAGSAAPRRRLPARLRKRTALAGAAVGLAGAAVGLGAAGGLGGFALGHEIGRNVSTPAGIVRGGTPDGGGFPGRPGPDGRRGPVGGGQGDPGQDGSGQDPGPDPDDGGSGGGSGDDA
jgi:hypothetical protein